MQDAPHTLTDKADTLRYMHGERAIFVTRKQPPKARERTTQIQVRRQNVYMGSRRLAIMVAATARHRCGGPRPRPPRRALWASARIRRGGESRHRCGA